MPKTDPTTDARNIVQLPTVRRPIAPPSVRVARPQPLAAIPFEAWIAVRDRVAAALLGGSRCVLITGAAGTGKTVMLDDLARVLRAAGRTVTVRQADTDPAAPGRGETLFVDEADRLPRARLRQLLEGSAGTVVLAGLGSLAQRAGGKPMQVRLAPLEREAARAYVVQWLASTGRVPAHLESAALRQVVEASGGVPRLLSTLLGAGAWLAESGGTTTITAGHIREAAELRCVTAPAASAAAETSRRVPGWTAVLVGASLAGGAALIAMPRLYPGETAAGVRLAGEYGVQARAWLGAASGKPANPAAAVSAVSQAAVLPPVSQHVSPRPEMAVVGGAGAVAGAVVPALIKGETPELIPTLPETDAMSLPVEMQAFLVHRGRGMAAVGDLSAARSLFRRAAEGGSAEAAYALGRSYDPAVQTGLGSGQADGAEAMLWYRRAAEAGDAAAQAALGRR